MNSLLVDKLRKKCEEILFNYKYNAFPIIKEAFSLINKLLMNIARSPKDEKFRIFKKSNQAIKSKVLIIKECLEIITEIGYVDIDSDILSYTDADLANIHTGVNVLNEYIQVLDKKIAEIENEKELKQNEEARKVSEEVNRKFKEEKLRQLAIQKQMELDKQEKKNMKATDSIGKHVEFGAKVCKFEPKRGGGGG